MVLTRDDVKVYSKKKYSDSEMEDIANKLEDALMYDWGFKLSIIVKEYDKYRR
jgi:uncharacterized protein (DUF1697 family)